MSRVYVIPPSRGRPLTQPEAGYVDSEVIYSCGTCNRKKLGIIPGTLECHLVEGIVSPTACCNWWTQSGSKIPDGILGSDDVKAVVSGKARVAVNHDQLTESYVNLKRGMGQ